MTALGVVALATIFLLPRFVSEPWIAGSDGQDTPVQPSPMDVAPSTAAEKTRYRQESQTVLAGIIAIRDRLQEQNVEQWAEIEYRQAMALIESGDERYSFGEYKDSLENYRQALDMFTSIEEMGKQKLATALAAGSDAVESLNINVAAGASELASLIAGEDERVILLAERVAKLPELTARIDAGDLARQTGRLQDAESAFAQAVALDPLHRRAGDSLAAVKTEITDSVFRGHMSRGYAALENNDFAAAREHFSLADTVYPGHSAIGQALAQVENEDSRAFVNRQIELAAELESAEQWGAALDIYDALLRQDPTLAGVKARQVPARVRQDLDQRLEKLIGDPLKLSDSTTHRVAKGVLIDAQGIAAPGERLNGQIALLERLLKLSLSPVNVTFRSDNLTHVTLFRVKDLGLFSQTSLVLKPGRYVAAGTRRGFRDVRVEFTVTGEPLDEPVVVQCEESI